MNEVLNNGFTKFWDFVDNRGVIRRIVLGIAIWFTWLAGNYAFMYAMEALAKGKADAGIAAVIAAFTMPATALAGYVFKAYLDSKAPV
jgi:hypothetical protein